jgi:ribosomal protein L29
MDKIHSLDEEILLGIVNLSGRTRSVIESELRERVDMRKSQGGDNEGAYTISLVRKYAEIANALKDEYCDLVVQSDAKTVETPLRNSEAAVVQDLSTLKQRLFKLRMLSGGLAIISLSVMATASHIGSPYARLLHSMVSMFASLS